MANFCYNSVTITGNEESISKLNDIIKKSELEDGEYNRDILFDGIDGVEIRIYDGMYIDIADIEINMSFDSAWSPPIELFQKFAEKYNVDIEMYYDESGSDFCGTTCIDDKGNIISEEDYEYSEGMYKLSNDFNHFFESCVSHRIEVDYNDDGDFNIDTYIDDEFSYVSDVDRPKLKEYIENEIKDLEKSK